MPAVQLSAVDVTPRELYGVMRDKYEWLQWLARHRLITVDCGVCNCPMALVSRAECSDGYSWRCFQCSTRCSVRRGSFLANCELRSDQIIIMMYFWVYEVKCKHVIIWDRYSEDCQYLAL